MIKDGVLLRLLVPKNNEKTPLAAEQLFATIHGIYSYSTTAQQSVSLEIAVINGFIQFYVFMSKNLRRFIEGQIYSQYPNVEISEVPDYASSVKEGQYIVGTEMITTKEDVYPIKTFLNFDVDPLAGITGVLSQVGANEEIWVQIIISPVDDSWQRKGLDYIEKIKSGSLEHEPLYKSTLKGTFKWAKDLARTAINPVYKEEEEEKEAELPGPVKAAITGIEEKVTKLGFMTKIRIVSSAGNVNAARNHLNSVAGSLKQFNLTNLNGFREGMVVADQAMADFYARREFGENNYILNIEELASIFHLPSQTVQTPTIVWSGSKRGEPPYNLPVAGTPQAEEATIIGKTHYRAKEEQFGIKIKDRLLHSYCIGKTGTGKSTLLQNMIIDDMRKGRGVAVVDPHGDLIRDVLEFVPQERIDDVVYFSPAERDFPVAFNPLESVDPDMKNIVASGVVGIFKKIFGDSWGPRLEYILRNTILGLLDYKDATMLGINRILVDAQYRRKIVSEIKDPIIRDFFINEYERYDQKFRTEAIAPIQNKVGQFLSSSTIRNIVGQPKSSIDIRDIMDNEKIFFLDLSIGKIGEDNSALLGAMMITKMQLAAMSRAGLEKEKRIPFYLYVDEFQNFATDSFAVILSEARKYGLSIVMTNQYIAQMPEEVAHAVFGNVGTIISFRVGASDANDLQREFEPVFDANDLVNLDNYYVYVKMSIDGVTSVPFSAKTLPAPENKSGVGREVIDKSLKKYGANRKEIEEMIENESRSELTSKIGETEKVIEGHATKNKAEEKFDNLKSASDEAGESWYFVTRTQYHDFKEKNNKLPDKKNKSNELEKDNISEEG